MACHRISFARNNAFEASLNRGHAGRRITTIRTHPLTGYAKLGDLPCILIRGAGKCDEKLHSRTTWDDDRGGARNHHDANFLTFHRWKNFRGLTRSDDVPMPGFVPLTHESAKLIITGSAFQIASLKNGETSFSNRSYKWRDIPDSLSKMSFTRLPGGGKPVTEVTARADAKIRIVTATDQDAIDLTGWKPAGLDFRYDDPSKTRVRVFTRELKKGETLRLPSGNWTGAVLLFD